MNKSDARLVWECLQTAESNRDGEDSALPLANSDAPESAGASVCGDEGTTTSRIGLPAVSV